MAEILKSPIGNKLGGRLRAWWNGDEMPSGKAKSRTRARSKDVESVEDFPSPSGVAEWTPQRIASIQCLYGEGIDSPSGRERALKLVNPIGLNERMTVLNLGACLGTSARAIAKETGAWVDGLEQNDALLEEAVRLSAKEGLAKKAVIRKLDMNAPEIREHKRDAVVAQECLHLVEDRDRLFKSLNDLIKPSSHLLITEFLTVAGKGRDERSEWSALHPAVPQLFELDEIREGLNKTGFDIRVAKDETKAYMSMILNDIRNFGESLHSGALPRELQEWVMWEVEYWARTFNALDAGGITLHRIHAVTPMEDPTKIK